MAKWAEKGWTNQSASNLDYDFSAAQQQAVNIEYYGVQSVEPVKADPVTHPEHYTSHPSGVECLTITRHMNFNLGNAFKYIWRAGLKGDAIEDLRKAVFYLEDEIKRREGK